MKVKKSTMISIGTLILGISVFLYVLAAMLNAPDNIYVFEGKTQSWRNYTVEPVNAVLADQIHVTKTKSSTTKAQLKLFGVLPIKTVDVTVLPKTELTVLGKIYGIKLFNRGVMVVGMSDVQTDDGPKNPAYESGIRVSDVILKINEESIDSISDLNEVIQNAGEDPLRVHVKREGEELDFEVQVCKASDGSNKIGAWVRNSTAGIGTMSFYQADTGVFAGLGHSVSDVDTGQSFEVKEGELVDASVVEIKKGTSGEPGEIRGMLTDRDAGSILANDPTGIYGVFTSDPVSGEQKQALTYEVAGAGEVSEGDAQIISNIEGENPKSYDVTIEKIYQNAAESSKNMVVRVTDQELIDQTGGIVQGMSGSPIIQNGKIIGVMTHVFVNDPTKGYAIFADTMVEHMGELAALQQTPAA